MDWTKILEGPRGRQLCTLLAISIEQETWQGSSESSISPLHEAYFYSEVGQPGIKFFGSGSGAPVASQLPDIVTALKNLAVMVPDSSDLPDALEQTVGAARYWQKPDRRDHLFAEPEVIELLKPWAEILGKLPQTAWWSDAINLDHQYLVVPKQHPERMNISSPSLAGWREWAVDEELRARRERPVDPSAAISGVWWSTPMVDGTTPPWPDGPREGKPLAVTLLEDQYYSEEDAVWAQVVIPTNPRVYEITGVQDWTDLCRANPLDVSASRRHDWYVCTGRVGDWVIPDWSAVAKQWDGIHLPLSAYLELVGRALPVDDYRATVVAGWSPGMTYWLTPLAGLREPNEGAPSLDG